MTLQPEKKKKGTTDRVKVFNGIRYTKFSQTLTKKECAVAVQMFTEEGHRARSVKVPGGWAVFLGGKRRDAPTKYGEKRKSRAQKKEVYPKKGQKIYKDRWDATEGCAKKGQNYASIPHYRDPHTGTIFYLYKVGPGEFVRVYGNYDAHKEQRFKDAAEEMERGFA